MRLTPPDDERKAPLPVPTNRKIELSTDFPYVDGRCSPAAARAGRRLPPRPPPRARPAGRGGRGRGPDHGVAEQPAADTGRCRRRTIGGWRSAQLCSELAEREGFEPSVPRKRDNGFRDR